MQVVENIEFIERQHQKLHRYISKSIDIEGINATSAYQHFTNLLKLTIDYYSPLLYFFRDAAAESLIYIGYYMNGLTEYVFCFYAPVTK